MPRLIGRRRTYAQMMRGTMSKYRRRRRGMSAGFRRRRSGRSIKPDGMVKEVVKLTGEIRTSSVAGTNDAFNTICWFDDVPPQGSSVF